MLKEYRWLDRQQTDRQTDTFITNMKANFCNFSTSDAPNVACIKFRYIIIIIIIIMILKVARVTDRGPRVSVIEGPYSCLLRYFQIT